MMSAFPLRICAVGAVSALLVTGLVTIDQAAAPPATAANERPAESETFTVAQGGASENAFLTADAQRVVFTSSAADLVAGDDNGERDVFLSTAAQGSSDPFSGGPVLVSAPDGPVGAERANGWSDDAVSSMDGRFVAFTSVATNLVDGPGNGYSHIYVRDTVTNATFRIQNDELPNASSYEPDLSDDGRRLVFTSDADNFVPGFDLNTAPDVYIAELDANQDGAFGDVAVTKMIPGAQVFSGTRGGVISGNGHVVALLSRSTLDGALFQDSLDNVYIVNLGTGVARKMGQNAKGTPSIDAAGKALAYVRDDACQDGLDAVVAVMYASTAAFSVAVGTSGADRASGWIADARISPDGDTVAWSTTTPAEDLADGDVQAPPLAEPVVRVQDVGWWEAEAGTAAVSCLGVHGDWWDLAEGSHPSLSATARTIAFQSTDSESILAVDTHEHEGISVSSTQGNLLSPSFITQVSIEDIPLATLRGYSAALADSPIHRLPIHRLPIHRLPIHRLPIHRLLVEDSPIHRLPIHRLPIHRLPIHRLDLPGGWPQVLVGTPFADELLHTVTLDEVLDWAAENPETAAGRLILSLTLDDVAIDGSGLDSLTLASYALGSAPVAELPLQDDGSPLEQWQRLVVGQGLDVEVDGEMVLADLDAAGLDIGASGIERLTLGALSDQVIDRTLLGSMPIDPALLPGTPLGAYDVESFDDATRMALFDRTDVGGTLAEPTHPLLATATFADLAKGLPDLEFGEVLFSLLDAESYPWEQLSASAIDPRVAAAVSGQGGCTINVRCTSDAAFRFSFDVGPGEPTLFTAPTASVTLPIGTVSTQLFASGSGPGTKWTSLQEYAGPKTIDGTLITVPLPDTRAGTVFELDPWFSDSVHVGSTESRATLTTGSLTATDVLRSSSALWSWDLADRNLIPSQYDSEIGVVLEEGEIYYEWISPASLTFDEESGVEVPGPADDEDFYRVVPPPPGKRLVVSTNATDGQIALELYSTKGAADAASLGVENAGPVPGSLVTEQTGAAGEPATSGADTGSALQGQTLIDQAVQRGTGMATVEAASTDAAATGSLLVRVTSGNGESSAALYSLRVRYIDEPVETVCAPWSPAVAGMPVEPGVSDPVTADTNTIYLVDTKRFRDTHGAAAVDEVRAALASLTGTGWVGETGSVQGAVLSIDSDPEVAAARTALDANPCSMTAREALSAEINDYVAAAIGENREYIESVVIVGGDDIIPFAPVAQHTAQFTEASHSDDLRLAAPLGGGACPTEVADGQLDPCATPLSAAAKGNEVLTDDPYGLATAYESLGGFLYVPTAALGRLVDGPDQILATIERFIDAEGVLDADSSLTGGYGAWSELPDRVTSALAWRSSQNQTLGDGDGTWTVGDLEDALFPDDEGAPRIVSVNTHADESRMLAGVEGAPGGSFDEASLFTTEDVADPEALAGALIFLIGCHAGNNLPSAYYGADAVDWVDVFSGAGGYVGNTGYGLANSVTTALSERLLELYSDWVGVEVDGRTVSASEALTYAKQSYLGGLGLYTGYDEKVLMEAVYYGLPMYTFADAATTKSAPVPEIPPTLEALQTADGISSASLTLTPSFQKITTKDALGRDVSYLVAEGQEPAVVAGQPVLPKIVSQLRAEEGLTPRGALITQLTSQTESGVSVAVAEPGVGVPETTATKTDAAFPSTFATITRQDSPTGPIDMLVLTPGRVQTADGVTGSLERFTQLGVDVVYGDAASTDSTPPKVSAIEPGGTFTFRVTDSQSAVVRGILLVQPTPADPAQPTAWQALEATITADGAGTVEVPAGPYRWILQVVDAAGNVAVESNRGHLEEAAAAAPELDAAGTTEVVAMGELLQRSVEVLDADADDRLTGRLTVRVTGSDLRFAGGTVPVVRGADGTTRATISQRFDTPGDYIAVLEVCRGGECSTKAIAVTVPLPNTAPTSTVTLSSDSDPVGPDAVLTAHAEAFDEESDEVSVTYRWERNGVTVPVPGATLSLASIGAAAGDLITVTVTPYDGSLSGHASSASLTVHTPPPPPEITATATSATGVYLSGTWSRTPVTVTFACSGVGALQCSPTQTVTADTSASGVVVTGTVRDLFGRTASTQVLVRVDRTAPTLAPVVTPNPVAQGATAAVVPNAADAASGVASATCAVPQTAVAGPATVVCTAVDTAGNTATAAAAYTVTAPGAKMCKGLLDRTALAPLNADGTSVFLRTSGVPITFRACDAAGRSIGTKNFVTSVTLVSTAPLPSSAKINELWTPPITGFAYLKAPELWLGQISTVKLAGGKKYTYKVLLADGSSLTFTFGVR